MDDLDILLNSDTKEPIESDEENRLIWLTEEITNNSIDIVKKIVEWNREDKDIPIDKRKPIRIIIHSSGGSLDIQSMICSIVKLSKTPVYGIALGMVASAATLIYMHCHKRYALPTAYFIVHKGGCSNVGGNFNDVCASMEDYIQQVKNIEQFYIEHTTYPAEVIHNKINTDWYIHSDEALKYDIVDEIIDDIDILI